MEVKNKIFSVNAILIITLLIVNQVKSGILGSMKESEEKDGYKLLKLLQSTNSLKEGNVKIKSLNELKQLGKETLNQLSNGESTKTDKQKLLEEIYHFDEELFVEIYKEVLNEVKKDGVYDKIGLKNLVSYTRKITNIEQSLNGFITIFNHMKNNNQLNNKEIFNLAHHVNDIKKMDNYLEEVSPIIKRNVEILKDELPACLKNILDSDLVYFRNLGMNEYMYAAGSDHLHDDDRRYVFSWVGFNKDKATTQGLWKMIHIKGGVYHIHSNINNNNFQEYLYAANFTFNTNRRFVFTWLPGGDVNQGNWQLELESDYCYIKNNDFGEYMYSPGFTFDPERREVFTWGIKGKLETDKYFGWLIESAN